MLIFMIDSNTFILLGNFAILKSYCIVHVCVKFIQLLASDVEVDALS